MEEERNWYDGVPAPVDRDGEPIRVGDVLYSRGNECRVVSITVKADEVCVGVRTDEGVFLPSVNPKYLSRKNPEPLEPEPPDSLEKLSDDLGRYADDMSSCSYLGMENSQTCDGCPAYGHWNNCASIVLKDVARRIAALREVDDRD